MFDSLRENFELILVVLFIISAVTYAIYRTTFYQAIKADLAANREQLAELTKKKRKEQRYNISNSHINTPFRKFVYFFADLFWVLLFVVVMRSFLFEPFVIPSGSMKPGLQIGDVVLVNKFEKGLRLPVTNARLTQGDAIKHGDVIVFKYPKDPKMSYIKRVIGLPGDSVSFDGRHLAINGKPIKTTFESEIKDHLPSQDPNRPLLTDFSIKTEDLLGVKHSIQYANLLNNRTSLREWVVPEGKYLMFGDNRDNSSDGRIWGYVDDSQIIGRAKRIALNWGCLMGDGMCDRFFKKIQ